MQKGPRNDPELMTLLARAQSLSGRPGDALVMLRRLAQLGASVDLGNDDFERVRALPAWPELAASFERADRAAPEKPVPSPPKRADDPKDSAPPVPGKKPESAKEAAETPAAAPAA